MFVTFVNIDFLVIVEIEDFFDVTKSDAVNDGVLHGHECGGGEGKFSELVIDSIAGLG